MNAALLFYVAAAAVTSACVCGDLALSYLKYWGRCRWTGADVGARACMAASHLCALFASVVAAVGP